MTKLNDAIGQLDKMKSLTDSMRGAQKIAGGSLADGISLEKSIRAPRALWQWLSVRVSSRLQPAS